MSVYRSDVIGSLLSPEYLKDWHRVNELMKVRK